jgi:hypothetical protein
MGALGILILYFFYGIIILIGLFFLKLAFASNFKLLRITYSLLALCSFASLTFCFYLQWQKHRKEELQYVGTYYLTEYPNCPTCVAVLKRNNTYKVLDGENEIEKGNWRFESGGDYFILYMDNDKYQLGSGKFSYERSTNGFPHHE